MEILLFCVLMVQPQLEYVTDVKKVYEFANYLYRNGDYESAIIEYERVIFLLSSLDSSEAKASVVDTSSVFLQIGRCYLLLGQYEEARNYLSCVDNDTSYALIGFSLLDERDLAGAENAFTKISDGAWRSNIKPYFSDLRNLHYKSPLLAGLSSAVLPGMGRIYSGRIGDGIFSFIFTVGSFALANYYYEKGNRWATGGFGTICLLFYLGDIYGSVEAVKLHNAKIYYNEVDKIRSGFGYLY